VVAAGVAEALFTTAAGLLVAVPAVLIYNNFVRRMGVMLTITENHARTIRLTSTMRQAFGPDHRSRRLGGSGAEPRMRHEEAIRSRT
jgi:hypothetical protein